MRKFRVQTQEHVYENVRDLTHLLNMRHERQDWSDTVSANEWIDGQGWRDFECPQLQVVDDLVKRLECKDLPLDYDPCNEPYNLILARIRHNYTNYEPLLYDGLPDLGEPIAEGRSYCPCPYYNEGSCIWADTAHDQLKWAAKSVAERVYSNWLDRRQSEEAECETV